MKDGSIILEEESIGIHIFKQLKIILITLEVDRCH